MVVHTSIGGKRLRLELTNPFGATAVTVGSAHIAIRDKGSDIVPSSDRALTVNGSKSFKMIAGATVFTDPVDLEFAPLSDLAVSLFFSEPSGPLASHSLGLHTTYFSGPGDFTAQPSIAEPIATSMSYYWISSVDVLAPAEAATIVTLGDSITDGSQIHPGYRPHVARPTRRAPPGQQGHRAHRGRQPGNFREPPPAGRRRRGRPRAPGP
jgi:hypothetical protein